MEYFFDCEFLYDVAILSKSGFEFFNYSDDQKLGRFKVTFFKSSGFQRGKKQDSPCSHICPLNLLF